jgi:hypothetical protein
MYSLMSMSQKEVGNLQVQANALATKLNLQDHEAQILDWIERGNYRDAMLACRRAFIRERNAETASNASDRLLHHTRLDNLRQLLDTLNIVRLELRRTTGDSMGT